MSFDINIEDIISNAIKSKLEDIAERCVRMYQNAIYMNVYRYYKPTWYDRDNIGWTLHNSVYSKIIPDKECYWKLKIYNKLKKDTYKSYVTGEDVSEHVPRFVDYRHQSKRVSIMNQFYHYEARLYSEYAKKLIEQRFSEEGIVIDIEDGTEVV